MTKPPEELANQSDVWISSTGVWNVQAAAGWFLTEFTRYVRVVLAGVLLVVGK